jgi:hypothetical protein
MRISVLFLRKLQLDLSEDCVKFVFYFIFYQNAAFHGVKGHKTNVTIEWTAPQDFQGKVIFT